MKFIEDSLYKNSSLNGNECCVMAFANIYCIDFIMGAGWLVQSPVFPGIEVNYGAERIGAVQKEVISAVAIQFAEQPIMSGEKQFDQPSFA